ncbi:hypothetical protein GGR57DRAFT_508269 [Xylariaceae sp. FL1272]|nr:hypothetical protein GGR57DRAFT_508269 [Xylariaceae sp. FL1272]
MAWSGLLSVGYVGASARTEEYGCLGHKAAIFTIASFANSAPMLYWTLLEVYSRPALPDEVSRDLAAYTISGTREKGFVLDVAAFKVKCALIVSVMSETQRTRQVNSSFRKILVDTLLDGKHVLKRGNSSKSLAM